ncbi:2OG-Fe dioxygenase family protein [Bacillus atrophaeus]|uniref:2OG-Fe dioxygenase family protein n=1 Tax=Bacillus atrophaeus TaxID=1452 RepID=UPI00227F3E5C|nr:2OG-Fe dioxygenase family protein [Bacillus atrophaeus]MCY8463517.1 2OG-Fe dioxygenase family protein [Bacillus atrophaeus]MCY8477206.1 2OG-Fe dioxygenase family protein [Bacillus atrophaeus]MCY8961234.1 2OG-Fe dioxygenase family protein [Bacillus atrophaeus]MCY8962924.1 2OG-Fe dioxygenase family protein [Bacillus atrophaeus]MCY9438271.1 2OG-Fe dioxygenase family protein [Bacillus atrophaeus]
MVQVSDVQKQVKPDIFNYASFLLENGYSYIPADFYQQKTENTAVRELQTTYDALKADPKGGGRYRAHSRYILAPNSDTLELDPDNGYFQSKEYNYDDGGTVRQFEKISDEFLLHPVTQYMINTNVEIARQTDLVEWEKEVIVGLHQIRYHVTPDAPSYSSPIWLHRDDEPLVFVHLFKLSEDAIGGDNLIAPSVKQIDKVLRLTHPLETIALGQKVFHAVTPVGTANEDGAHRDILLVTFSNR